MIFPIPEIVSNFHDALLMAIDAIEAPSRLSFVFKLADGRLVKLNANECAMFRVNDFISQNIVSNLHVISGISEQSDFILSRLKWLSSLSDTAPSMSDVVMLDVVEKVRKGEYVLFSIEPSWGAEVVCLCRTINGIEM